ncbi:MAG: LPXTG cell wall anchor domain-containing protein [Ferruginibacter sp.]|nr:LPXTG cell wall anchor domain-containing protein [Chitinophagaceae bacterium]
MKKKLSLVILAVVIFLWQNNSFAQPFTLEERVQPTELKLVDFKKTDTMQKGRINMSEITQNKDTSYYFVKGLSIFSPVYFGLTTNAESGNIKINLCKDNWHQVNQNGETGSKGHWQANFKTEGDFGIMVIAENKPADYSIVVWVGDEAKDVGIPSPFKDGDEKVSNGKKENFLKKNMVFIIVGLVLVVGGILYLKKKKN